MPPFRLLLALAAGAAYAPVAAAQPPLPADPKVDVCLSNACSERAVVNVAPKPTTTAQSCILAKPTQAQHALFRANAPDFRAPPGQDQAAAEDAFIYGTAHLMDVSEGPRRSVIPSGYTIVDTQSVWLADGTAIPDLPIDVPNDVVSPLGSQRGGRVSSRLDGLVKYRVEGDQVILTQVLIVDGVAISVDNLRAPLGGTAVVQVAGGHTLQVSPKLRRMSDAERARFEEPDDPVHHAESERQIEDLVKAGTPAASTGC